MAELELGAIRERQLLLPKGSPGYLAVGREVALLMEQSSNLALEWEGKLMDLEEARRQAAEAAIAATNAPPVAPTNTTATPVQTVGDLKLYPFTLTTDIDQGTKAVIGEVENTSPNAITDVSVAFNVLDADGQISRSAIGQRVFASNSEGKGDLEFLEGLVHPKIGETIRMRIEALSRDHPGKAVVVDAALLIEADWAGFCDKIVFLGVPRAVRLARAKQRGWSESEFSRREAAQGNLDTKRKQADWVMDNSGSAEHTFAVVQQFWRTLA